MTVARRIPYWSTVYGPTAKTMERASSQQEGGDAAEAFDYPPALIERIAKAIEQAAKNAKPINLRPARAKKTNLAFNRRFHMKDGSVRFNPGRAMRTLSAQPARSIPM